MYGTSLGFAITSCGLLLFVSSLIYPVSEDGGNMFLRNVGLSPKYTLMHPRRLYSAVLVEFAELNISDFCVYT
jgi:hypothetical protein